MPCSFCNRNLFISHTILVLLLLPLLYIKDIFKILMILHFLLLLTLLTVNSAGAKCNRTDRSFVFIYEKNVLRGIRRTIKCIVFKVFISVRGKQMKLENRIIPFYFCFLNFSCLILPFCVLKQNM